MRATQYPPHTEKFAADPMRGGYRVGRGCVHHPFPRDSFAKWDDIGSGMQEGTMTFAGMNYWAVLMAAVAAWMLGALWYSLLSTPWMAAAGVTKASMEENARSIRGFLPFIVAFVAALVMAWVLAGIMGHLGQLTIKSGVISGAFCWLGFTIPAVVVNYTFARRRPLLVVIDGGYWLAALVVMGAIIGGLGIR
jgi:hypothetical protein